MNYFFEASTFFFYKKMAQPAHETAENFAEEIVQFYLNFSVIWYLNSWLPCLNN